MNHSHFEIMEEKNLFIMHKYKLNITKNGIRMNSKWTFAFWNNRRKRIQNFSFNTLLVFFFLLIIVIIHLFLDIVRFYSIKICFY